MTFEKGLLFDKELQKALKAEFCYADEDPEYGKRLFFENSGGSLRLRRCVEAKAKMEAYPDCPERFHERSLYLKGLVNEGTRQIMEIIFGAEPGEGALLTELTASQAMFQMVGIIMRNAGWGTNAVMSVMEHPSAFDAVEYYCNETGRELRVAHIDPKTGKIEPEEIRKLVDKDTVLLSVMSASNITGIVMDLEAIVKAAREINPDIYIVSDAVQHAPHMAIDVRALGVDGMNIAPYKFFGIRGCGYAYVSERVAHMTHHKLLGKAPKVFELGTPSPGNFAAMLAVIDYVCGIGAHFTDSSDRKELFREGMKRIHLQERALLVRLLEGTDEVPGLRHINGVRVFMDPDSFEGRDLIAGFLINGIKAADLVVEYQRLGVTVCERAIDSLYSERIVREIGADRGVIRVSPLHCHGTEDIDEFLRITAGIAARFN
ncbi:MAG: aminotransferase class V-fold PLP-dependent enzyme [Firmicutes bacterium]|nr:aminotransferase class V-fold PLP-dependent enzyme [Bacillota bacterium]